MAFAPPIMPYLILTVSIPTTLRPPTISPMLRSQSATPCSTMREMHGAGGLIHSDLSKNLDPTLTLPDPSEVIRSIAIRSDPAAYLRSFQPDHPQFEALRRKLIELRGSDSDGKKAGANTARIRAILLNMERWRWLPNDLGPFYVNVNVPEFMLRVVDEGKVIHTARVVVGKRDKQTPIFSNEMQEVVFNPVWNVPTSIKTEEILPWVNSGGGFVRRRL